MTAAETRTAGARPGASGAGGLPGDATAGPGPGAAGAGSRSGSRGPGLAGDATACCPRVGHTRATRTGGAGAVRSFDPSAVGKRLAGGRKAGPTGIVAGQTARLAPRRGRVGVSVHQSPIPTVEVVEIVRAVESRTVESEIAEARPKRIPKKRRVVAKAKVVVVEAVQKDGTETKSVVEAKAGVVRAIG